MARKPVTVAFGVDLKDFQKGLKDATREMKTTAAGWASIGGTMKSVGGTLTASITAPLLGAAGAALKFSTDFNAGMANVATLIPGSTARIQELKENVRDLSNETGKSAADLADGLYQVISAFGDTADASEQLAIATKAAIAGNAETADAVNLLSAVTKGYGDTSVEAQKKVSDLAFQTVKLGVTTFPELAASMGKVIPLASELTVSQQELFAVMATGTGVTGNTAEVSTQLRGVLQALLAPTADMSKLFGALGVESGKALLEQKGLHGAMQLIVQSAEASGIPLQKLVSSIEGQTLALALTGSQADVYVDKLDQMRNSMGATDEAYKANQEGINKIGVEMNKMVNEAINTAGVFGDSLQPAFAQLVDVGKGLLGFVQDAIRWFAELPTPVQSVALGIGGVTAAIGPMLLVGGQMIQSFGAMQGAIAGLSKLAGGLPGILAGTTKSLGLMGQAALLAGAAFAAWELGKWAADNIPIVGKLGDALAGMVPQWMIDRITGVTAAERDLEEQTAGLSRTLRDKFGIEVDRGGRSVKEWHDAVMAAWRSSKDYQKAVVDQAESQRKNTAAAGDAKAQIAALLAEVDKLAVGQVNLTGATDKATDAIKRYEDAQNLAVEEAARLYAGEMAVEGQARALAAAFEGEVVPTIELGSQDAANAVYDVLAPSLPAGLEQWKDAAKTKLPESKGMFAEWADGIRSITGSLGTETLRKLFTDPGSLGDIGDKLSAIKASFVEVFTTQIGGVIDNFIKQGIGAVMGALDGLISKITGGVGGALANVFGSSINVPAGSVPSPSSVPSVPSGGGGGGGGGTAGGGSSILGWATLGVGIADAVIGGFQRSAMNKSLDVIVKHTLEIKNGIYEGLFSLLGFANDMWQWGPSVKLAEGLRDNFWAHDPIGLMRDMSTHGAYLQPTLDHFGAAYFSQWGGKFDSMVSELRTIRENTAGLRGGGPGLTVERLAAAIERNEGGITTTLNRFVG